MRPIKLILFLVVGASTLLIGIGAGLYFAPATHPAVKGQLVLEETPEQEAITDQFFQKHYGDFTCSHVFFGRDDQYIYVDMMCGNFKIKNAEVLIESGHHMYRRIEYKNDPFTISGFSDPADGAFHAKSLVSMFPEDIYQKHIQQPGATKTDSVLLEKIRRKLENL